MKKSKNLFLSCTLLILLTGCTGKQQEASITPTTIPEVTTPPVVTSTDVLSGEVTPATTSTPLPTTAIISPAPTTKTPIPSTTPSTEIPSSSMEPTPPAPTILAPTKELSPTKKPTPLPTKPPAKVSISPMPTPDIPTYTDEEFEYFKNAWLPSVELSEANFPDEAFRDLLSKVVDKNKDDILTLEERKTLTYLRDTFYMGDPGDPEPKIIYRCYGPGREGSWCPINLNGLPNLEEFYFHWYNMKSKNTLYFNFEHLPKLKSIKIETNNPEELSHITLEDTESLNEFWFYGSIVELKGLEQTNIQRFVLELKEQSNLPNIDISETGLTFNLEKFKNLYEFHFRTDINVDSYLFTENPDLKILSAIVPSGEVILRNMPNLYDVRMLGGTAIRNENCPNIDSLMIAMEKPMTEPIEYLDLRSFYNLKVLDISWSLVKIQNLLLPNDNVYLFCPYGNAETLIFYNEQPYVQGMQQTLENAFKNPSILTGSAITYESIADEFFSKPGIFEFIYTPEHGYQIDLNGDGIEEELYTDSQDFYINGKGLNLFRTNDSKIETSWEKFWILVSDENPKYQLIVNITPFERSYHYLTFDAPRIEYWDNAIDSYWKEDIVVEHLIPDNFIGQFLLSYDENLYLQAYAEGKYNTTYASSSSNSTFYPFAEAEYNSEGISFSHMNCWVKVYGTDKIPSLYFSKNAEKY